MARSTSHFIWVLLVFGSNHIALADESLDPHYVKWQSAIEALWSWDVSIDVVVTGADKDRAEFPIGIHRLRQRYLQGKWRVDFLSTKQFTRGKVYESYEAGSDVKAWAFDGKTTRFFNSASQFGQTDTHPHLDEIQAKLLSPLLQEAFKEDFAGVAYPKLLSMRPSPEIIKKDAAIVLFLAANDPKKEKSAPLGGYDLEIELSNTHGLPTSMSKGEGLRASRDIVETWQIEYGRAADGLTVPVNATCTVFSPDITGSSELPASKTVISIDMMKSTFNVDIDPIIFEVPFPPGTAVRDMDAGGSYIVTEGNEKDYAAYSARVKDLLKKHKTADTKKILAKASFSRVYVLVGANIALLLVLFGAYRISRRKG